MKRQIVIDLSTLVMGLLCLGCATGRPPAEPIPYLAVKRPEGVIRTVMHQPVKKDFWRGGWYLGNHNFRPAPDVASYVRATAQEANTDILRNADVRLPVPFAVDILFFGYNKCCDSVKAKGS
jgi:hypothetical protein